MCAKSTIHVWLWTSVCTSSSIVVVCGKSNLPHLVKGLLPVITSRRAKRRITATLVVVREEKSFWQAILFKQVCRRVVFAEDGSGKSRKCLARERKLLVATAEFYWTVGRRTTRRSTRHPKLQLQNPFVCFSTAELRSSRGHRIAESSSPQPKKTCIDQGGQRPKVRNGGVSALR